MDVSRFINPVLGRESELIDLYSEFYGEEYRDKISHNIDNTIFIFIDKDMSNIKTVESKVASKYLSECYDRVGISIGMAPEIDDIYRLKHVLESQDYSSYIDCYHLSAIASSLGYDVDNISVWLSDSKHYLMVMSKVNECIRVWESEYEPKVSSFTSQSRSYTASKDAIDIMYKQKIDNLYLEHMQSIADKCGVDVDATYLSTLKALMVYGRDGLNDVFLSHGKKDTFIRFFQSLGIQHDSYKEYVSDEALLDMIYDSDFRDKLDTLSREYDIDMVVSSPQFQDAKSKVDTLDLVNGNYDILASIYEYIRSIDSGNETAGFVSHELCKDGTVKHICVLPTSLGLDDDTFYHELGHIVQYSVIKKDTESNYIKNGLERMRASVYPKPDTFSVEKLLHRNGQRCEYAKKNTREYTYLNEVIHEFMIQLLMRLAERKGLSFGMRPKLYDSVYTRAYPAIENIVSAHLDRFKDCCMSDDPLSLERFIGVEALDKLSDAVEYMMTIDPIDREAIMGEVGSDIPMSQLSDKTRWYLGFMSDVRDIEDNIKE